MKPPVRNHPEPATWTPPEIAARLRINVQKVLGWISSGELSALNIATKVGGRPRYRIRVEDLQAFELRRTVVPPPPPAARRRRQRRDDNVIQFF